MLRASNQPLIIAFNVRGNGEFPVDMLRYDSAWPVTSDDAAMVANQSATAKRRTVRLNSVARFPHVGRWQSFGWHVVNDNDEPMTEAEAYCISICN